MSFVDLATLTMHRRTEMEGRINTFDEKCDRAIIGIKKMKMQAHSFVSQLNCEPTELKERFLTFMKKLDEYTYLITDFNLAISQIEDLSSEHTPVQDNSIHSLPPTFSFNPNNLMDALSEPAPSTTCACSNLCPPEKPKRASVRKEDQLLIAFSSSSTSSESVPIRKSEMVTKEVQCKLAEEMDNVKLEEASDPFPLEPCNLPQQTILEVGQVYKGIITAISGAFFWIIIAGSQEVTSFMEDITDYYQRNKTKLTVEQAKSLTCCVYYDDETNLYYRALCLSDDEDDAEHTGLFLVDTGEMRSAPARQLQPLAPQFSTRPPYARYCHLAGLDQDMYHDKQLMQKYESFMLEYVNVPCTFHVDDNSSESMGMYVVLPSEAVLNEILVERGLGVSIDKYSNELPAPAGFASSGESSPLLESPPAPPPAPAPAHGPPELAPAHDSEIDILDCPEYEDPVEAVTGYHNRDEADICKHYKGEPGKTCFKGSRCTKRHVRKHPDGWTLDRVEVMAKCKTIPLPEPDTWLRVYVTRVCHFDRAYVQIVTDKPKDEVPEFGVVLPPTTLEALVRDMNSAAARSNYKPLTLTPAPGEMVAAIYPLDQCWYRARVLTVTRADQSVEVMYVDYGTVIWVKEDQIRELDPRFAVLPIQAIPCVLAGVYMKSQNSAQWARAKRALEDMIQDKTVHCHVIARDYDEITVELLDDDEYSVAHQLAARDLVQLRDYAVCPDAHVTQRAVVP